MFFRIFIAGAALCGSSIAASLDNFPLWGSTWIIGEGENGRIFPSAARYRPKKVAKVSFTNKKEVFIRWANLESGKPLYSTAEAIEETQRQFRLSRVSNEHAVCASTTASGTAISSKEIAVQGAICVPLSKINADNSPVQIAYRPYNDTVWTLHKYAAELFKKGYDSVEIRFGNQEKVYRSASTVSAVPESEQWTSGKPVIRAYRRAAAEDVKFYMNGNPPVKYAYSSTDVRDLYYSDNGSSGRSSGDNYYDASKNTVAEYFDHTYGTYKTADIGFWQVHIAPEVWFYPRSTDEAGTPAIHDVYRKTESEALALKKQSVEKMNDANLKMWRSPVISDSTSTILSFSFMGGPGQNKMDRIALDAQDPLAAEAIGSSDIFFTHIPKRMYRVDTETYGENAEKVALVQLSSRNDRDEHSAVGLYQNCPAWEKKDKSNSNVIFPTKYSFTSGGGGKYGPGYTGGISSSSRNRDWDVDDGVFMYDGCPCTKEYNLSDLTPVQVRKYLYKNYPTHSPSAVYRAAYFFASLQKYLTSEKDQQALAKKIQQGNQLYNRMIKLYKDNGFEECTSCPKSWLDDAVVKNILNRNYGI